MKKIFIALAIMFSFINSAYAVELSTDLTNMPTLTSKNSYSNQPVEKIIDNSTSTYWLSADSSSNNNFIQLKFPIPVALVKFRIAGMSDTYDPNVIKVLASSDGTTWQTLQEYSNCKSLIPAYSFYDFNLTNADAYSYYKFELSSDNNQSFVVTELECFADLSIFPTRIITETVTQVEYRYWSESLSDFNTGTVAGNVYGDDVILQEVENGIYFGLLFALSAGLMGWLINILIDLWNTVVGR